MDDLREIEESSDELHVFPFKMIDLLTAEERDEVNSLESVDILHNQLCVDPIYRMVLCIYRQKLYIINDLSVITNVTV